MHRASHAQGAAGRPRRRDHHSSPSPTRSVSAAISMAAPSSECVIPRCHSRYVSPERGGPTPGAASSSVQSGALPATAPPWAGPSPATASRSEEHTSELQSRGHLVCRLLLEKKKKKTKELKNDEETNTKLNN